MHIFTHTLLLVFHVHHKCINPDLLSHANTSTADKSVC